MQIKYVTWFVDDMAAAVTFFRDVVGVPLRFESPEWSEFETGEATLALHSTGVGPGGPEGESTPAGVLRTGFRTDDIDAFHARMEAHGVACRRPPTELHGFRIAEYEGPGGAAFSVSAPAG